MVTYLAGRVAQGGEQGRQRRAGVFSQATQGEGSGHADWLFTIVQSRRQGEGSASGHGTGQCQVLAFSDLDPRLEIVASSHWTDQR